jgi:hypothetical protein
MLWDEGIVWGGTYLDDWYNPSVELVRVVPFDYIYPNYMDDDNMQHD